MLSCSEGQVDYSCTTSQMMALLTHADTAAADRFSHSHGDNIGIISLWGGPGISAVCDQGQELREWLGGGSGEVLGIWKGSVPRGCWAMNIPQDCSRSLWTRWDLRILVGSKHLIIL